MENKIKQVYKNGRNVGYRKGYEMGYADAYEDLTRHLERILKFRKQKKVKTPPTICWNCLGGKNKINKSLLP